MSSVPYSRVTNTSGLLMSLHAFYGLVWGFFAFSVLVFSVRIWIRWVSLRKSAYEDFVMFFVLCLQLAAAITYQLRLSYIYTIAEVSSGRIEPPPSFLEDVLKGLRGQMAIDILIILSLWGVKFSFLLFFYRIFCSVERLYRYLWWGVFVITTLCLGAFFSVTAFRCMAKDVNVILTECTKTPAIHFEWVEVGSSAAIEAFNDMLIMIFPIAILWRVRISFKKKLYLSLMFMLTLFTVIMAIIHGTINYGEPRGDYKHAQNISWVMFSLQMESNVSFLIACLVSFPGLFRQSRMKKSRYCPPVIDGDRPHTFGSPLQGVKGKSRNIYDSILDTCHELEDVPGSDPSELEGPMLVLSELESKTGDGTSFNSSSHERLDRNWLSEGWVDNQTTENEVHDRMESVQSLRNAYFRPGF